MKKSFVISLMLASLTIPLAASAEMPGQPCEQTQVGTSKMSDDKRDIIACLKNDNPKIPQPYVWKSQTYVIPQCDKTEVIKFDLNSNTFSCRKLNNHYVTSPAEISKNCVDSSMPDPLGSDYRNYVDEKKHSTQTYAFMTTRFFNTCGERYCQKLGYSTGRAVEHNEGSEEVTLSCF